MVTQSTGRGITTLSLKSWNASPFPVFQTFTALSTLRLELHYVSWLDLQKLGHLVHLQHLQLSEIYQREAAEPQDRAFARNTSGHGSPFSCLTGLQSLKLDLHESSSADPDCDGTKCFLRPISCMSNLQGFTLFGLSTDIGIQHLSQLSQLTSLHVDHIEDGLHILVKLKHLKAATINWRLLTLPRRRNVNLYASLVTLTNLRSLDCHFVRNSQVSYLTVLIALEALTIALDHQSRKYISIWSDLAELKRLNSLFVYG